MFASSSLMTCINSALLVDEDCRNPLERAIKFAKSKLLLQRTVMARSLVEIAHEIGYEDFVAHLLPSMSVIQRFIWILGSDHRKRCVFIRNTCSNTGRPYCRSSS